MMNYQQIQRLLTILGFGTTNLAVGDDEASPQTCEEGEDCAVQPSPPPLTPGEEDLAIQAPPLPPPGSSNAITVRLLGRCGTSLC